MITEMQLSNASLITKQKSVINELQQHITRHLHKVAEIENLPPSPCLPDSEGRPCLPIFFVNDNKTGKSPVPNSEEAVLIREFNSTLFEKLAESQEQVNNLKKKAIILQCKIEQIQMIIHQVDHFKTQLARSRQEVNNYIRRIKAGALIVETEKETEV
jgi:hypothetical protein